MKTEFMNKATRTMHKLGFKLKQHSPEILVAAGVVGTVATVVMACKATLKLNDIVDESKELVGEIHDAVEQEKVMTNDEVYTQEIANKDLTKVYLRTGLKVAKLYAPTFVVGTLSLGCMLAANNILHKRNVALAAAVTALDTNFKEYRGRVIERFGKELDRELRFNIQNKEVDERVVDENGNETVEKKVVPVMMDRPNHSIYSIVFDDGNLGWTKSPELNKLFLIQREKEANLILKTEGFLCLNDVYKMLGAHQTQYGQTAGWVYSEDGSSGDNFVDFGMFDIHNENTRAFINGNEKVIVLDFNCIGDIRPYL